MKKKKKNNRICCINVVLYCFILQCPDFDKILPHFIDLRTIISNAENGLYQYIFEVIRDLQNIVYNSKLYLKLNQQQDFYKHLLIFDKELNIILESIMNK